mmetsp:Transcript_65538/g.116629  ORF Transcript_65538/g.116629 Transcript_65538/m.116629 type:complete len:715 (-) Transcript_65538:382-2526(-)
MHHARVAAEYKTIKVLGRGAFAEVHLAKHVPTSQLYVLKRLSFKAPESDAERNEQAVAAREVELLCSLRHPHITTYKECFLDCDSERLNIVLEFCQKGTLDGLISSWKEQHGGNQKRKDPKKEVYIPEDKIWGWASQLLFAISYCHSQNIIHRDIKPANIFLTNKDDLKLGDFGIAKNSSASFTTQNKGMVGTPFYLSPEVCEDNEHTTSSDIWALGVSLYELCALRVPFAGSNILAVLYAVSSQDPPPLPDHFSPKLNQMVFSMLCKVAEERPSADELICQFLPTERVHRMERTLLKHTELVPQGIPLQAPRPPRRKRARSIPTVADPTEKEVAGEPPRDHNTSYDPVQSYQVSPRSPRQFLATPGSPCGADLDAPSPSRAGRSLGASFNTMPHNTSFLDERLPGSTVEIEGETCGKRQPSVFSVNMDKSPCPSPQPEDSTEPDRMVNNAVLEPVGNTGPKPRPGKPPAPRPPSGRKRGTSAPLTGPERHEAYSLQKPEATGGRPSRWSQPGIEIYVPRQIKPDGRPVVAIGPTVAQSSLPNASKSGLREMLQGAKIFTHWRQKVTPRSRSPSRQSDKQETMLEPYSDVTPPISGRCCSSQGSDSGLLQSVAESIADYDVAPRGQVNPDNLCEMSVMTITTEHALIGEQSPVAERSLRHEPQEARRAWGGNSTKSLQPISTNPPPQTSSLISSPVKPPKAAFQDPKGCRCTIC